MRDPMIRYQMILSGLIGAICAIILVSLSFSIYGASQSFFTWSELDNIGSFWNGHISVLALLIIAVGLYLQAEQFRIQQRIEQSEQEKMKYDNMQGVFQILESRITQMGETIRGYELVYDDFGKESVRELHGIWEVSDAMKRFNDDTDNDNEVWVNEHLLVIYARKVVECANLCEAMNEVHKQKGTDHLWESLVPTMELVVQQEISNYIEKNRAKKKIIMEQMKEVGCSNEIITEITIIMERGWRVSVQKIRNEWSIRARNFTFDRRNTLNIASELYQDLPKAFTDIVDKWNKEYAL